jgi:hypothetical protein
VGEIALISIFVLVLLSFPVVSLLVVRSRSKKIEAEPDAGAYSAWKVAEFARLEQEWMEAWVDALTWEDQEYVRKYDFAGWHRGPEAIEQEIHRRLVHWERQRINNRAGGLK